MVQNMTVVEVLHLEAWQVDSPASMDLNNLQIAMGEVLGTATLKAVLEQMAVMTAQTVIARN